MANEHAHKVYSHFHGRFYCACGAMRNGDLTWTTAAEGRKESAGRERQAERLIAAEGTSVNAYGQTKVR